MYDEGDKHQPTGKWEKEARRKRKQEVSETTYESDGRNDMAADAMIPAQYY